MKNIQQVREVGEEIYKRCSLILTKYHGLCGEINSVKSVSFTFNREREIGNEVANRLKPLI